MNLPSYGVCLPCHWRSVIDGNEVVVSWLYSTDLHLRLLDCRAERLTTEAGRRAKAFAEEVLEEASEELSVFIPLPETESPDVFSHRADGYIFINTHTTLNEMLVAAGHATKL